jgi:hypothetical protein
VQIPHQAPSNPSPKNQIQKTKPKKQDSGPSLQWAAVVGVCATPVSPPGLHDVFRLNSNENTEVGVNIQPHSDALSRFFAL